MSRKSDKGSYAVILIFIFICLMIFLAIATPIVLIVGYFYSKIKFNGIRKRLSNSFSDFWLTEGEKKQYKNTFHQYKLVSETIEKAHQKAEDANISINKDGSYSLRSNLGKEIRQILEENEPICNSLGKELNGLQQLPIRRWDSFSGYAAREKSFLYSLLFWCGINIYYLGKYDFDFSKLIPVYQDVSPGAPITIVTILTILVYFGFHFIFKNRGRRFSPVPPEVTMENIDRY